MRRREFVTLIGGAAAWPIAARAQQAGLPVVGVLSSTSSSDRADAPLLSQELKAAGYIDGQNVAIEYHWADGQFSKLPAMALDLVRRKVAVMYASNAPATFAAKAATTTIPIVFAIGGDPVEQGIVARMNRPEANITGVTFYTSELGPKRLEVLRQLVPQATTVAFLTSPSTPVAQRNRLISRLRHVVSDSGSSS
jgi:putative ABC transport system substrate-binding protein